MGRLHTMWTVLWPKGSQNSHTVYPAAPSTGPSIKSMSGVSIRHIWIPQGTDVSPITSKPCYCGFVIRALLLILLGNLIPLQGTKVLEDREVRTTFRFVNYDAPEEQASMPILRYTGTHSSPEWTDIERGSVFSFDNFVRGTQVKQTNSRHCAMYRQTSLRLRTKQNPDPQAGNVTHGNSM